LKKKEETPAKDPPGIRSGPRAKGLGVKKRKEIEA